VEEVVRQFLLALPPKFEQIAASIETLLNLERIMDDEHCSTFRGAHEPQRWQHRRGPKIDGG
jgi:hypothetical protein